MRPRLLPRSAGKILPVLVLLLVALLAMPAAAASKKVSPPAATDNPFDQLKGYWTGGGTLSPVQGNAEKVSCRVIYSVDGPSVAQTIRCAGTDYKVNTRSKLTYSGGKISGSWSESTYDAAGSVSGTAQGNTVYAVIDGAKFAGRMSINVSGSSHTINIQQLDNSGGYRSVANVSLHR
jgi:hypothetical protein